MKTARHRLFSLSLTVLILAVAAPLQAAAPDNWRSVRSTALKAVRSDEAAERESAFESFREQDHVDAAELLVKTMNSPNVGLPVRRHARDVLGTFRSEESRDHLYGVVRSKPKKNHLLLEAFAAMEDERAPEIGALAIKSASREKDGGPIVAAAIRCLVASGEPAPQVIDSIIERAGDGHPIAVRIAATDSLLRLRTPAAVEKLIGLLDDPALRKRAHVLMVRLAREDLGPEKKDWASWLEKQNGKLPAKQPIGEPEARELIAARSQPAEGGDVGEVGQPKARAGQVTFYGVPIEGKNVIFVLDASSSMRGYPLERLKVECRNMVEQLPETHKFALIFFPRNECFPQELQPADQKTKQRAYVFIDKREVIRGTPIGEAMKFAYRRFVLGQTIDAIYLLSDGAPTKPIPEVLQMIDDLNLGRYISIHTIYIGKVPEPDPDAPAIDPMAPPKGPIRTGWEFLKEVARRNNGTFTIVPL